MAVGITTHGLRKPDLNELARTGGSDISFNAQKTDDLVTASLDAQATLAARLGVTEAKIDAGAGGVGLSADPDNPGLYYFAGPTITPDPGNPGFYTF